MTFQNDSRFKGSDEGGEGVDGRVQKISKYSMYLRTTP